MLVIGSILLPPSSCSDRLETGTMDSGPFLPQRPYLIAESSLGYQFHHKDTKDTKADYLQKITKETKDQRLSSLLRQSANFIFVSFVAFCKKIRLCVFVKEPEDDQITRRQFLLASFVAGGSVILPVS